MGRKQGNTGSLAGREAKIGDRYQRDTSHHLIQSAPNGAADTPGTGMSMVMAEQMFDTDVSTARTRDCYRFLRLMLIRPPHGRPFLCLRPAGHTHLVLDLETALSGETVAKFWSGWRVFNLVSVGLQRRIVSRNWSATR